MAQHDMDSGELRERSGRTTQVQRQRNAERKLAERGSDVDANGVDAREHLMRAQTDLADRVLASITNAVDLYPSAAVRELVEDVDRLSHKLSTVRNGIAR